MNNYSHFPQKPHKFFCENTYCYSHYNCLKMYSIIKLIIGLNTLAIHDMYDSGRAVIVGAFADIDPKDSYLCENWKLSNSGQLC